MRKDKDYREGRRWALKVFRDKLKKKDLPNLGRGCPDEYRAAYAIREIATNKLYYKKSPFSADRRPRPLFPKQKSFWTGVLDEALELIEETME
jgi:hypothetical protein